MFFQSLTVQATPYVDTIKEQATAEIDLPIITAKGKLFSDPEVVLGMIIEIFFSEIRGSNQVSNRIRIEFRIKFRTEFRIEF